MENGLKGGFLERLLLCDSCPLLLLLDRLQILQRFDHCNMFSANDFKDFVRANNRMDGLFSQKNNVPATQNIAPILCYYLYYEKKTGEKANFT